MKRVVILIGVLLVAAAAVVGLRALWPQTQKEADGEWQEVRVVREDLAVTVSATGNVAAERSLNLVFNSPGVVENVQVERGDVVEKGDLLAQLETDDLALAVRQAQAALEAAKAGLAQALAPPREEEIDQAKLTVESAKAGLAAAQADLASAEARLAQVQTPVSDEDLTIAQLDLEAARVRLSQLQAGADETAIEIARLSWEIAKNSVWQAQLSRDAIQPQRVPGYQKELAKASVGAAELSARISELQYQQAQEGVSDEDIRLASIAVSQSQARLAKLQTPVSEEDLAVAQAAVDAARARVHTAQAQVSQADAAGGVPAVVLVDLSSFHMEVEIDELDVGQVSVGQEVIVTLDALPDVELEGRVKAIAPTAFQGGGVVSYFVTVGLEVGDALVREGMSATVNIVTQRLDGVLTVPNRALRLDRDSGKVYVEKLVLGMPREVQIETGFRDELVSQVLSGLDEGDTVIVRTVSSRERLREAFSPPHQ